MEHEPKASEISTQHITILQVFAAKQLATFTNTVYTTNQLNVHKAKNYKTEIHKCVPFHFATVANTIESLLNSYRFMI